METTDPRTHAVRILAGEQSLDRLLSALERQHLTNCSGSAFREVRLAYFADGVLLITNRHQGCIRIASDPATKIKRGCQDSWGCYDAAPTVESGELITVWAGREGWIRSGPWEATVEHVLTDIIRRLNERDAEDDAKLSAARHARHEESERLAGALVDSWTAKENQ